MPRFYTGSIDKMDPEVWNLLTGLNEAMGIFTRVNALRLMQIFVDNPNLRVSITMELDYEHGVIVTETGFDPIGTHNDGVMN